MEFLLDFILHIDQYMIDIVQEYHTWAYVILFIIIFAKRDWLSLHSSPEILCFLSRELFRLCPICLWKLIFSLWFYFFQLCWAIPVII